MIRVVVPTTTEAGKPARERWVGGRPQKEAEMSYFDQEYPPLTGGQVELARSLDREVGRLLDEADAQDAEAIDEAQALVDYNAGDC